MKRPRTKAAGELARPTWEQRYVRALKGNRCFENSSHEFASNAEKSYGGERLMSKGRALAAADA